MPEGRHKEMKELTADAMNVYRTEDGKVSYEICLIVSEPEYFVNAAGTLVAPCRMETLRFCTSTQGLCLLTTHFMECAEKADPAGLTQILARAKGAQP